MACGLEIVSAIGLINEFDPGTIEVSSVPSTLEVTA
jgi:hypothetical protein